MEFIVKIFNYTYHYLRDKICITDRSYASCMNTPVYRDRMSDGFLLDYPGIKTFYLSTRTYHCQFYQIIRE